ncbi:glycosyltransferase family 2 protein [Qipengyuania sp. NPDC077410]|uniref:glycosyltransferase family 2 protein n=1 Tax=Qipengyuania sp. NPDC077410 TaxID=3364496 RepID=UPI0037C5C0F7
MRPIFYTFMKVVLWRPFAALVVAWWWLTGRKVRAANQLWSAASSAPFAYIEWLRAHEHERYLDNTDPNASITVAVHIEAGTDSAAALRTIRSVMSQRCKNWDLFITGWVPKVVTEEIGKSPRVTILTNADTTVLQALVIVLERAMGEWFIWLEPGNTLAKSAVGQYLAVIDRATSQREFLGVVFGDQDEQSHDGTRKNPWLKPKWNAELFLAQDFISDACALPVAKARTCLRKMAFGSCTFRALLFELLHSDHNEVRHLPAIVSTTPEGRWRRSSQDWVGAVDQFVARQGGTVVPGPFGTVNVRWPLPQSLPMVSIIIPSRDHVELLATCVQGVLDKTAYHNLEVVIVNNSSVEKPTLDYFEKIVRDERVRVISWPHPYNYSEINNFGVSHAAGEYVCLLNNDIEIINDNWLREMMRYAVKAQAGAVGARLLYPDASIQHAGVVVGLGAAAGHAHRALPNGAAGYFARPYCSHEVTAVTAACLLVRKEKFEAIGGFDVENFAIAYSDTDLCLRLKAKGWRNYFAAQAQLLHHESKSRSNDFSPERLEDYMAELRRFQQRWSSETFCDPLHHVYLDRASETYALRFPRF